MGDSYLQAGAVAGLVVVAIVGVLLFRSTRQLRAFLAGLVGPDAARWALVFVWFAYAYSAVSATVTSLDFLVGPDADPTAVAFGRGALSQALVPFLDRFVGLAQIGVLALAALLFYRGVREADREASRRAEVRTLARAFALVYGTGLVLTTLQVLFLSGDTSEIAGAIGIGLSVLAAFVYAVGMDPVWWLALALLAVALRRHGRVGSPSAV